MNAVQLVRHVASSAGNAGVIETTRTVALDRAVIAEMWAGRHDAVPEGLRSAIRWTKPSRSSRRARF
jgi:hypothetical protein